MLLYHVYATNLNTSVHVALHVSGTISLVEIKVQRVVNPIMAAPTVATKHAEGYDCEFVDAVPEPLTCSVCLLTLRDPHLLDCCGVKMCGPCVSRIRFIYTQDRMGH